MGLGSSLKGTSSSTYRLFSNFESTKWNMFSWKRIIVFWFFRLIIQVESQWNQFNIIILNMVVSWSVQACARVRQSPGSTSDLLIQVNLNQGSITKNCSWENFFSSLFELTFAGDPSVSPWQGKAHTLKKKDDWTQLFRLQDFYSHSRKFTKIVIKVWVHSKLSKTVGSKIIQDSWIRLQQDR